MAKKVQSLQEKVIIQLKERFCKVVNVEFENLKGDIVSIGCKSAINNYKPNDREEVSATSWFDDEYWFYIRISFLQEKKSILPIASISFFQNIDGELKQLFRAEWDSYLSLEGYNHPQPHWHFTAQLSDKVSFDELENEEDANIFNRLAGNSKSINLDRMHFAMAGTWLSDGDMLSNSVDENSLVDWMIHLFSHVREELKYKNRRKV